MKRTLKRDLCDKAKKCIARERDRESEYGWYRAKVKERKKDAEGGADV